MGTWDEVSKLVKQGKKNISIQLTPGNLVKTKTSKRGRPRTRDPLAPFKEWKDPRAAQTQFRARPRCLREGCKEKLGKNDIGVCSEACAQMVKGKITFINHLLKLREEAIERANGETISIARLTPAERRRAKEELRIRPGETRAEAEARKRARKAERIRVNAKRRYQDRGRHLHALKSKGVPLPAGIRPRLPWNQHVASLTAKGRGSSGRKTKG